MAANEQPFQIQFNDDFVCNMFGNESLHEQYHYDCKTEDYQVAPIRNSVAKDQSSLMREDISLNFTVTSREGGKYSDWLSTAMSELDKFKLSIQDLETNSHKQISNLSTALEVAQQRKPIVIRTQDFATIKRELFREDINEPERGPCRHCMTLKKSMEENLVLQEEGKKQMEAYNHRLASQVQRNVMLQLQIDLVNGVEIKLLNEQIHELETEIHTLKFEKANLEVSIQERTFLFNKTKQSELQKSKGLSAAKNSTYCSDAHREPLLFIDSIEPDVEEWIKFFEIQRERYDSSCKREEDDIQIRLGRTLNEEEQIELQKSSIFVIKKRLKSVVGSLKLIKSHVSCFGEERGSVGSVICENQEANQLRRKMGKLQKINEGLTKEKANLEESNRAMKESLMRENTQKNDLERQIEECLRQLSNIEAKCSSEKRKLQEGIEHTGRIHKEETLKFLLQIQELRGQLQKSKQKISQGKDMKILQSKLRCLEKINQETNAYRKELDSQIKCLDLRLRKERIDRKLLHNQIEQGKGNVRVYVRIRPKQKCEINFETSIRSLQNRVILEQGKSIRYDRVFANQQNGQEDVFSGIEKLVQSAFDGHSLCIFAYGHPKTGKSYTINGTPDQPGIIPRIIRSLYKLVDQEKDLIQANIDLTMIEVFADKVQDILGTEKNRNGEIKEDESLLLLQNWTKVKAESLQIMQSVYSQGMKARRAKSKMEDSTRHSIISIGIELISKKTNERWQSKISVVELAAYQKSTSSDVSASKEKIFVGKSLSAVMNMLCAISNKFEVPPYRESKLTSILKDCLHPTQSKIVMFINITTSENNKEESLSALNFGARIKHTERVVKKGEEVLRERQSISRLSNQ